MPLKNPPHPGDFIRTEIIEPAGLSVTAAAAALRVSRPALSSLLNGKADLSGDMALRIEKAFGVKMDTLMRMQASYDIAQTRKREKQIHVRRIQAVSRHSPMKNPGPSFDDTMERNCVAAKRRKNAARGVSRG
jgi:antitoxin HigA-1